ncbi:ABC transporter permease subunit [Occultella glacieicola]|uniref:Maltose/maltodextrin transport system permease protein n=1 Tax=Occultella glacieicola TaxID=2518684 RepID=A0ABY2DZH1_9MICO|nr:ABC transporter permease subunit [Occultella glacieicola]TDE90083.1 ABC transporter permease subunit [Occultella glacieicola]
MKGRDAADTTDAPPPSPDEVAAAERAAAGRGTTSHAREMGPYFVVKLVLLALIDAFGLFVIFSSWQVEHWGILASMVAILVVVNWVYFSRRMIAAKYLFPGLVFLLVYQLFTMGYTAYISFTNYGTGHNATREDAVAANLAQNESRVPDSPSYPLTVVTTPDGELGFAIVDDGEVLAGTAEQPFEESPDATVADGDVTEVPGYDVLSFAQILEQQNEITNLRVGFADADEGSIRTQDGSTGYLYRSVLTYDEATGAITNTDTGVVYTDNGEGSFQAEDGSTLLVGWRVAVGFDNYTAMFTDSRLSGPFLSVLAWTFAFAILSVGTTFFLGLFLAIVFNHPAVRGRRVIRSLLILPYAFPGFLSGLVWAGLLNRRFGFINEVLLGGAEIPWLTDPWLAKLSVIGVNLWLGFPYMFLIATGALQAISTDMYEAARIDGAGAGRVFRSITLPLLMISLAPLLIASFAFNFNNFNLIFFLTEGGPNFPGSPIAVGATDILISMVYSVAFESGTQQFGLASAMAIMIFIMVGVISWLGFRQTHKLEEVI